MFEFGEWFGVWVGRNRWELYRMTGPETEELVAAGSLGAVLAAAGLLANKPLPVGIRGAIANGWQRLLDGGYVEACVCDLSPAGVAGSHPACRAH